MKSKSLITSAFVFGFCISSFAQLFCPSRATDNTSSISTIPNTYYPPKNITDSLPIGVTSVQIGSTYRSDANRPINAGDLVMLIQMQGQKIDFSNTDAYGDGKPGLPASGALQDGFLAGNYEFLTASNSIGTSGGELKFTTPTKHIYVQSPANSSRGQYTFQIIHVPVFKSVNLLNSIQTPFWDGKTGGVMVLLAKDTLNMNGFVLSADTIGFRGGASNKFVGLATGITKTDFRIPSTGFHFGSKGEGTAGTPRYVFENKVRLDLLVEGYPQGSYGRGAPGNAGGGGNDSHLRLNTDNAGGGGGGNGGFGGRGGNAWSSPKDTIGGFGGYGYGTLTNKLIMGGGGGAGSVNNTGGFPDSPEKGSGGTGGGLLIVQSTTIKNPGKLSANGQSAINNANDGGGGGGAGGTVIFINKDPEGSALTTINADGGTGGKSIFITAHGPGGGGGGGVILSSYPLHPNSSSKSGPSGYTAPNLVQSPNTKQLYGAISGESGTKTEIYPKITIQLKPGFSLHVCEGTLQAFRASVIPNSPSPSIVWRVNKKIYSDSNTTSFSGRSFKNKDKIQAGLLFFNVCGQQDTMFSNLLEVTIDTIPEKPTLSTNPVNTSCTKDSITVFTTPGYQQYIWTQSGYSGSLIRVKPINTFDIAVAVVNGLCKSKYSDTLHLKITSPPAKPKLIGLSMICFSDSTIIMPLDTIKKSFTWNGKPDKKLIIAKPGQKLTVIADSAGCKSIPSDTFLVKGFRPSKPNYKKNNRLFEICSGDSVLLEANSNNNIFWNTGNTSKQIWAKSDAKYSFYVDSANCKSPISDTVQVKVYQHPAAPKINFSDSILCFGDTLKVTVQNSGKDHYWSNSKIGDSNSFFKSQKAWVVSKSNNCVSDTLFFNVKINPSINKPKIVAPLSICYSDSAIIMPSDTLNKTFVWNGSIIANQFEAKPEIKISVIADSAGCKSLHSDTVMIASFRPTKPNWATSDSIFQICNGDSVLLKPNTLQPIRWNNGSIKNEIWAKTGGVFSFYIDSANCNSPFSDSVLVKVLQNPDQPKINSIGSNSCKGDTVKVDIQNPVTDYKWSDGTLGTTNIFTTARKEWVISLSNKCISDTLFFDIDLKDTINFTGSILSISETTLCSSDTFKVNIESNFDQLSWFINQKKVDSLSKSFVFIPNDTGIYKFELKANSDYPCKVGLDSFYVTKDLVFQRIPSKPSALNLQLCKGDTAKILLPDNNIEYHWSDGYIGNSRIKTSGFSGWVKQKSGICFSEVSQVDVVFLDTLKRKFEIELSPKDSVCLGEYISIRIKTDYPSIRWGFNDSLYNTKDTALNILIDQAPYNLLTLKLTSNESCNTSPPVVIDTFKVFSRKPILPNVLHSVNSNVSYTDTKLHGGLQWFLLPDTTTILGTDSSLILPPNQQGDLLYLTVYKDKLCPVTKTTTLISNPVIKLKTKIPNVITPNGDGINDTWEWENDNRSITAKLYNRWGRLVIDAASRKNLNDNVDILVDGVYFYVAKTNDGDEYKGWLQVIR